MEPDYSIKGFKYFFINVVAVELAKKYCDEDSDNFEKSVEELMEEIFARPSYLPFCRVMDTINAECADFTADFDSPDFEETFEDLMNQVMLSSGRDEVFLEDQLERFMWASLEVQRLLVEAYMLLSDLEEEEDNDDNKLTYRELISFPKFKG